MTPYQAFYAVWEKEPTFTVIYTSDGTDTTNDVEVKDLKVADYAAGVNLFTGNGDELPGVTDTYLYGGMYTLDENGEKVWGKPGDVYNLIPEAGGVYYVRRIHNYYLRPYYHYAYWRYYKKVTNMWLVTSIDHNYYKANGFIIKPVEADDGALDADNCPLNAYSVYDCGDDLFTSITVRDQTGTKKTITTKNVCNFDLTQNAEIRLAGIEITGDTGFAILDNAQNGEDKRYLKFECTPYWITQDNVVVLSKRTFTIEIHSENGMTVKNGAACNVQVADVSNLVLEHHRLTEAAPAPEPEP